MDGRAILMWFAVFSASSCGASSVSDSLVVVVGPPVSVQRSHTTMLPCWLDPSQSAEDLEVRWYRGSHFDNPVMLYRLKKVDNATQDASYAGRVSFGSKDTKSDGLKSGDVSLKLENAMIEDTGEYTCYVTSYQGYDSATINLLVTETGTSPLLSVVWTDDNRMNVSCESEGWNPQPVLRWSVQKQDLTPETVVHGKGSSGLVSVCSWVLVKSSSEVSCSVGLPNKPAKEARIHLEDPPLSAKRESGSSAAGWVAFALLLVATVLAVLGVLYFRKKGKKFKSGRDQVEADEIDALLPEDFPSGLHRHYDNIKLEDTNNKYLTVKGTILRDAPRNDFPDGQSVTCLTAIKGTPGFSSGKHYWEVYLSNPMLRPKQSWWVGVTSATEIPQKLDAPNTSNGFWFLSSSPDTADGFQFSTEPKVCVDCPRPQTVGVFLDYDGGKLSFYNVEAKTLIGSLKAEFTGEVFPLFNPGKGDKAPMEILHRGDENQSSVERDCVVSVVQENAT